MRLSMLEYGFAVHPIADGRIHRFRATGDKRDNGWYIFFGNYGAFGHWCSGLKINWHDKEERQGLTGAELKLLDEKIEEQRKEREAKRQQQYATASSIAKQIWNSAPAATGHPYLKQKQIGEHGVRRLDESLIVPMYRDKQIRSLQYIFPNGRKSFMRYGQVSNCYYALGKIKNRLIVCEGFATGASIFEATQDAVAVAFSGHNMAKIAKTFRQQFPDLEMVIAGDAGGEEYADKAAMAGTCRYVLPGGESGFDWNDLARATGIDAVREGLK